MDQTAGTAPHLGVPGNPYQGFPAVAAAFGASSAASPAASAFPMAMSSPFAQAGYHAAPDPWGTHPPSFPTPSEAPYAEPGFASSSQQQDPWAGTTPNLALNPWDPKAAAAGSPWDSARGEETPAAVWGGDQGGLDEGYRSADGRPAVALLVFGFAGKAYCWQPTTSPGKLGLPDVHVHQPQPNAVFVRAVFQSEC